MTPQVLDPGPGLTERRVTLPDQRRLRLVEAGHGDPLVVLETGLGAGAGSWVAVQRAVAEHTRTLSYDRAGYGGSDPDPQERTLARAAGDLCDLLDALDERRPVVLVGHSLGGPIVRAFAAAHPERVAGLCLVDATRSAVMSPASVRVAGIVAGVTAVLDAVGLARPLVRRMLPPLPEDLTPAEREVMVREACASTGLRAARHENRSLPRVLEELRVLERRGLPDVPTVSVNGEVAQRGAEAQRQQLNDLAATEMAPLTDGRAVVVPGAGHFVPQQQPGEIAREIVQLLDRVR